MTSPRHLPTLLRTVRHTISVGGLPHQPDIGTTDTHASGTTRSREPARRSLSPTRQDGTSPPLGDTNATPGTPEPANRPSA